MWAIVVCNGQREVIRGEQALVSVGQLLVKVMLFAHDRARPALETG